MPQPQTIFFDVGDPDLSAALDFVSQSVVVDNYTNQYLHLLGEFQDFVPPYTFRAVYRARITRVALAKFEAPPGLTQAPIIANQSASIEYHEDALPPSTGTTLTPFAEQELLGTLPQGGAPAALATGTFSVPPGTHALGILIQDTADFQAAGSPLSSIKGVQSSAFYYQQNNTWEAGLSIVPIASIVDTQITVSLTTGVIRAGAKAFIIAIKDVEAVQIYGGLPFVHDVIVEQGLGVIKSNSWDTTNTPQPFDFSVGVAAGAGTQAVLSVTGSAGIARMIAYATAHVVNTAAGAAILFTFQLRDGATTVWTEYLALTATQGDKDQLKWPVLAFACAIGATVQALFTAGAANSVESISMGVYNTPT